MEEVERREERRVGWRKIEKKNLFEEVVVEGRDSLKGQEWGRAEGREMKGRAEGKRYKGKRGQGRRHILISPMSMADPLISPFLILYNLPSRHVMDTRLWQYCRRWGKRKS